MTSLGSQHEALPPGEAHLEDAVGLWQVVCEASWPADWWCIRLGLLSRFLMQDTFRDLFCLSGIAESNS